MSSMYSVHRAAGPSDWSHSTLKATDEGPNAHGFQRGDNTKSYFNSGLPTPPGSKTMPGVMLGSSYAGFPIQNYHHDHGSLPAGSNHSQHYSTSSSTSNDSSYSLVPATDAGSLFNRRMTSQNDVDAIAPHLQIPESVNKSKGSLAEFAAEITCLFWFETANTLQYAEDLPVDTPVDRALSPDTVPTIGFRKWVTTIISTTQVGKNVILLALMFIYRLKRFNPSVSGKRGSEFRLLTIALMLGNKFLDDNTYTNKTWAEVSGISVTEIHIMEVEFLSNMRYDLYASAAEWIEWKAKLGRFGAFYDKASRVVDESRSAGTAPVTPTSQTFSHKLPSPPSPHRHVGHFMNSSAPLNGQYPALAHPLPPATQLPPSPLRHHHAAMPYQERKRSSDYSVELPPAKRQHFAGLQSASGGSMGSAPPYPSSSLRVSPTNTARMADAGVSGLFLNSSEIPRLDMPRLPSSLPPTGTQLAPLSVPANRAMSSVYPPATSGYSQPVTPISAVPQNLFQNPIPNLGDGSRSIPSYSSVHTSPSNGFNTTTPTLPGLSPSYFLTHRASPYRPVRYFHTLLNPPPSAALQAPVRNVSSDQIHYQPLSKVDTERRTGLLPFMQPDGWQSSNVSTPIANQHYHF